MSIVINFKENSNIPAYTANVDQVNNNGRQFTKIELTTKEKFRNVICIIFTLGIILLIQEIRLKNALKRGDIETAKSTMRWWAEKNFWSDMLPCCMGKLDILELVRNDKLQSIELLISQIYFDPNCPYGGRNSIARSIVEARDSYDKSQIVSKLFTQYYGNYCRTYLLTATVPIYVPKVGPCYHTVEWRSF